MSLKSQSHPFVRVEHQQCPYNREGYCRKYSRLTKLILVDGCILDSSEMEKGG